MFSYLCYNELKIKYNQIEMGILQVAIDGKNSFEVEISDDLLEHIEKFRSVYDMEIELQGDTKIVIGDKIEKSKRKCRFCEKSYPEVSFKEETHIIPQQWNRAKPISTFECDACNYKFSMYESDFGHYFLLERALYGKNKKKPGKPKFKTKKGTILKAVSDIDNFLPNTEKGQELKKMIEKNDLKVISIKQDSDAIEVKMSENSISLDVNRKPYKPINVFKIFLKIGLSLIHKDEINEYSTMIKFLQEETVIKSSDEFEAKEICLVIYSLPIWKSIFEYPTARLYKKHIPDKNYIDKTLVIYFLNKIYQIPIFSNDNLKHIYSGDSTNKISFSKISPYLNPFFSKEMFESKIFCNWLNEVGENNVNLYKSKLVTEDRQQLTISQQSKMTRID